MTEATAADDWTPLVIAAAPNGARKTKADHPRLPITPEELAAEAQACLAAGASMLHLHVRDADGAHTLAAQAYSEAIAAIRETVGDRLVIQTTTEAVGRYAAHEQMAAVQALRPEAVSLAVRELMPEEEHEHSAARFLEWCAAEGVHTQFILYDLADLERFRELKARGVVPGGRQFLLYVLGRYARAQRSDPTDLLPFLADPGGRDDPWMLCAFGPKETACAVAAATFGGHARVGFENNMQLPDGSTAPDNAALVAAVADGARSIGRPLADAATLRSWMTEWAGESFG